MSLRVGLIGLGFMGMNHARMHQSLRGSVLAAVSDVVPERMEGRTNAGGNIDTGSTPLDLSAVKKYENWKKLIADKTLDAIDICTPTYMHAEMAIKAMKAGKHCFCEKPMAMNAAQAKRMVETSQKTGKLLMIGHCLRFWPEYVMMKDMIDSGRYGRVRSAIFRRYSGTPIWSWDKWMEDSTRSGHCALDMHIHDVDTIQWLFGQPAKVTSRGSTLADGGVNHLITQYDYPEIPLVSAEGAWLAPGMGFFMAATIAFEKATVEYSSLNSPTLAVFEDGKKQTPAVPAGNGYAIELQYFIDCITEGKPPQKSMPEESARAVAITQAEIKSVITGRPVSLATRK